MKPKCRFEKCGKESGKAFSQRISIVNPKYGVEVAAKVLIYFIFLPPRLLFCPRISALGKLKSMHINPALTSPIELKADIGLSV